MGGPLGWAAVPHVFPHAVPALQVVPDQLAQGVAVTVGGPAGVGVLAAVFESLLAPFKTLLKPVQPLVGEAAVPALAEPFKAVELGVEIIDGPAQTVIPQPVTAFSAVISALGDNRPLLPQPLHHGVKPVAGGVVRQVVASLLHLRQPHVEAFKSVAAVASLIGGVSRGGGLIFGHGHARQCSEEQESGDHGKGSVHFWPPYLVWLGA